MKIRSSAASTTSASETMRVSVTDPERYPEYLAAAGQAFDRYGARFVVRGGDHELMEGEHRQRNVVVEFSDLATTRACFKALSISAPKPYAMPLPKTISSSCRVYLH